jgi:chorismate mutase
MSHPDKPADIEDWQGPPSPDQRDILARMEALRDEIDRIDEVLVKLLSSRAGCALKIGELKKRLRMEIYQPMREQQVLQHVRQVNQGPLDSDAIARLFERIIDEARRLERVSQEQED